MLLSPGPLRLWLKLHQPFSPSVASSASWGDGLHDCGWGAVKSEASQGFAHCCLLPGFGDLCA